jgi:RIH domain
VQVFQVLDGSGIKLHQKMLRYNGAIDLLIRCLSLLNQWHPTELQKAVWLAIAKACYDGLNAFVLGESRKNEIYIVRHFNLYMLQVRRENKNKNYFANLIH